MPDEFWTHLPSWLVWVFLGLILFGMLAQRLSESFPLFAKLIPVLGRYWRNRAEDEQRHLEERAQQLADQISERMKPADYDTLRREMEHIVHRVKLMEDTEEVNQAYLIEDAKWHWAADVAIAETGIALKFPPRVTYSEFVRKYREGWRPSA